MEKGISLLAIGGEGYMLWAVNLACTIRKYSPNLPIQLIASKKIIDAIKAGRLEKVFDYFTTMEEDDFTDADGKLFPAKAKLLLPEYVMFEKSLYIDVDTAVFKDLTPIFNIESDFVAQCNTVYNLGETEETIKMPWCKSSVIMQHYNIEPVRWIPSLNTSFLMIEQTERVQKAFSNALNNLLNNPIPLSKQHYHWGFGTGAQVDELYLNISLCQLKIIPDHLEAIYFRYNNIAGPVVTLNNLQKTYYAVGLYGHENANHISIKPFYNVIVRPCYEEIFDRPFIAKSEVLMKHKFTNQKFSSV